MNKLLTELIPYVRNGEVTLKTVYGDIRGIIDNLVVYSKAGDFFVRFTELSATPAGLDSSTLELPCWEIIGVNETETQTAVTANQYL